MSDDHSNLERLQRVLAHRGVASRRASEALITSGRVQVNGETVTELGTRVDPLRDRIVVDGKAIGRQRPRYLILNKPAGFITTVSDERSRWTVMDLINVPERVYPVGRLDRQTQGLLIFTNDGDIAHRIMHPRYELGKEYHVLTDRRPTDGQLQELRDGILVQGTLVVPDEVRLLREGVDGAWIKIVLHEGMFHVVRQMMDAVNIEVAKLQRHRVGPVSVTGLPMGAWRDLTPGELEQLFDAVDLDRARADEANSRRTMRLDPVGGYSPPPRIRHPKRYAEMKRRREKMEQGAGEGGRRERRPRRSASEGERGNASATRPRGTSRRTSHGKTRSSQSHRNRRSGSSR